MIDVSVIIPAYNANLYLARAIRSVIANRSQYKFEVIVVDDGSTDDTKNTMATFGKLIKSSFINKNVGLPTALNTGIRISSGRYIVRVDADDFVNENYIQILALFLDLNTEFDAVRCDYLRVSEDESVLGKFSQTQHPIGCAIMFRRRVLEALNGYDPNSLVNEDVELYKRFQQAGYRMGEINIPLYRYRDTPNSLSKENI